MTASVFIQLLISGPNGDHFKTDLTDIISQLLTRPTNEGERPHLPRKKYSAFFKPRNNETKNDSVTSFNLIHSHHLPS